MGTVAALELVLGEARVEAARALEGDIDAGLLAQLAAKAVQASAERCVQVAYCGHADALALHPDQREIAARGAKGDVALVEQRDALAAAGETPGDRRADQPAADDERRRSAGSSGRSRVHDRLFPPEQTVRRTTRARISRTIKVMITSPEETAVSGGSRGDHSSAE